MGKEEQQNFKITCVGCGYDNCKTDVTYDSISMCDDYEEMTVIDKFVIYCPKCGRDEAYF